MVVLVLRRMWLACLLVAAIVACVRLLDDAWRSAEVERQNPNVERKIIGSPPDYAFLNSAQPINPRLGYLKSRQSLVESQLESLKSGRAPPTSPTGPGFMGFGSEGRGGPSASTFDPATLNARLQQLEAEGKKLREEISAELLADCRQRLMRRGVVVGNGPCTDLDEIVRNLATGTYSFNWPKIVNLGDEFTLRLILQTDERQAASFAGVSGAITRVEERPFAQSVEATLSGEDLGIYPNGPQARTATAAHAVEWNWKLTPTATGTKTITIEVAANIYMGADKQRVQIDSLRETIEIQVTIIQRIKAYLADASGVVVAVAALVTPLAAIFGFFPTARKFVVTEFSRFRRRRSKRP
jgi:hypothetical protein